SFVKAHAGAIKAETRKSNLFKVRQRDNEMLREFVSRFLIEWMDLPPVTDDCAFQAFTQAINIRSSVASQQLKQNLIDYPAVTWVDVHNRPVDIIKRDIDREPRSNRDRYQSYSGDRGSSEPGRNLAQRRSDRGQSSRGLMNRSSFDKPIGPKEEPRLSEYNFYVDATTIVSAIEHIKDTIWPRPLQTHLARRDPNQMCEYHGTHGHKTVDCRQLREEVAQLFNNEHLREFLSD
ncbi:PREDICTED: uncharacterized protein LOC109222037, partial [Nicotiana attenuata]|uniref:uncharacterized protein LOC109222037 n=1 Tax=Nicotiana attenuata TaxID=49451 RepID=UPI00090571C2